MLRAADLDAAPDLVDRSEPAHRRLGERGAERFEMLLQEALPLVRRKLGHADLEIPAGDAGPLREDDPAETPEATADRELALERQPDEQAHRAVQQPHDRVTRRGERLAPEARTVR